MENFRDDDCINIKVISKDEQCSIKAFRNKSIMENLIQNNVDIYSPCGGKGTCGKCRIKIVKGQVMQNSDVFSIDEEQESLECLACKSYALSDCVIELSNSQNSKYKILKKYISNEVKLNPDIEIVGVEIKQDEFDKRSITDYINHKIKKHLKFSFKVLKKLSTILNESSNKQVKYSLYNEKRLNLMVENDEVIDIYSSNNTSDYSIYGIAVDIGTTTIVLALVNLLNGEILGYKSMLNSQKKFGSDVISRIEYSSIISMEDISNAVKQDVITAINDLCIENSIEKSSVYKIAISCNTVMVHLLIGLFCECISYYPFTTVTNDEMEFSFYDIFKSNMLNCRVVILPTISAYIGSDILSGLVKCKFYETEAICGFLDIGTNAEIAVGNKDKILLTSAAAGPAFEGGNIQCGTGSIDGAIYSAQIVDDRIVYKTVDNKPPVGICGSGIIDITSECIKNNWIDRTGKINKRYLSKDGSIKIANGEDNIPIIFNKSDIREVQLAKSAIYTALEILIKNYGCSCKNIRTLYIAGAFGDSMNLESAVIVGMIPPELKDKVKFVGNTSIGGSIEYLLDKDMDDNIKKIINCSSYLELSTNDEFNKLFIQNMYF